MERINTKISIFLWANFYKKCSAEKILNFYRKSLNKKDMNFYKNTQLKKIAQ